MATVAFAMPILPGKEDTDRAMFEQLKSGDLAKAYAAARRSQGITREAVWHQKTPMGTMAIVLIEANDLQSAMGKLAMSTDPFDQQFRAFVKDVHGVDLANDAPPEITLMSDTKF